MKFLKATLFAAALLAFATPAISFAQPHPGHYGHGYANTMRADMGHVRAALDNASFSSDKRAVIDSLVDSGNQFMCSDVSEIIKLMTFDDDQVYAAIKLYPNTIDKNNWYTVYESLTFSSSKEKVRNAVSSMPSAPTPLPPPPPVYAPVPHHPHPGYGPAPIPPKPQANIQSILRAIDNEAFSDGKRAVISSAAASNSFTCSDVAAIIRKMSFSDDQVYAATTLYDSTIDKNNWYTIYEAVTFSSDKDKIKSQLGL